ncbi:hypothetical protein SK3146_04403 [Paenibacillus konkukensis]|uniref:DUF1232 domain-containing protein n=1 Tax=Paenibacillus konkukensis TaxID=2020716 RepID=A0ABY4RT22_9BACL|nr:DUF1232 domain-containing protein [Paenibacillus doosanensis]UQZ85120.1 hypothetical protein SK3146_04403 [Paenibacillus konkukensis]
MQDQTKYIKQYSDDSFWLKMKKFAKKAGGKAVYAALLLFYALQSPKVPMKAKAVIMGALGYFISPLDAIPDITPGIGFGDDLGVLVGALLTIAMYIDADIKAKARSKVTAWFGPDAEGDLTAIDARLGKAEDKPS